MGAGGDELDAVAGRVLADLLARSHLLAPEEIGVVLAQAAEPLGVSGAWVYLADLQQRYLHAVPGAAGQRPHRQEIDGSTAGSAYQSASIRIARGRGTGPGRVWLPLLSGAERLGVLELQVSDVSEPMLTRYQMLASLAALLITSKSGYGDAYSQATRSQPMALQGEMVWAVTGPRTLATGEVLVTATLEPAYDVGGDAFDYSLLGDRLYVSVFDAVGHDVTSGLLTSVAMAACRSTRRSGGTLRDMVARADDAVARQFGDTRFVTALLAGLDTRTGVFAWIPCGHPPPLLIQHGKTVTELERRPQLPLGLGELTSRAGSQARDRQPGSPQETPVYTEQLSPGDWLVLYTDGVVEGRGPGPGRALFGAQRFTSFLTTQLSTGTPAPEILRLLSKEISEYQRHRLADDATIVLLQWQPNHHP